MDRLTDGGVKEGKDRERGVKKGKKDRGQNDGQIDRQMTNSSQAKGLPSR